MCEVIDDFCYEVGVIIVVFGGIGGNFELIKKVWFKDWFGCVLKKMFFGVFVYVDGCMIGIFEEVGGYVINKDCLWFYIEGVKNWDLIWFYYGICILSGFFLMWFDVCGK